MFEDLTREEKIALVRKSLTKVYMPQLFDELVQGGGSSVIYSAGTGINISDDHEISVVIGDLIDSGDIVVGADGTITLSDEIKTKLQTIPTITECVDDILTRLHAVEQVTSKPVKVDGDKVLSLDANNNLTSTLTVSIAKHTEGESEAQHEYIQLKGVNGELVSEVNIDQLVADGMIDSIAWSTEAGKENVLVITWNTASGKTPSEINMSKFIDTYTSGNTNTLTVSGYVITPVTASIAKDATGLAVAGDVWTITDALDKRVTKVEDGTNLIGDILTGTGSGRISDDDAKEWFTFEEGEISGASGKSALKAISDLEKSIGEGGDTAQAIANALYVAQGAQSAAEQAGTDATAAQGAAADAATAASNAQSAAEAADTKATEAVQAAATAQTTADNAGSAATAAQDTADAACNAITSWDPWTTYTAPVTE